MRDVVKGNLGLDKPIIYVDFHCFPNLHFEHHVDQPLIGNTHIFESKWHYLIAIQPAICDERGVLLVWDVNRDLIVPRICVYEAEQLVS